MDLPGIFLAAHDFDAREQRQPRAEVLKLRFWLRHEDFHNPTRQRVDINIDISLLTRRVMKRSQLQRAAATYSLTGSMVADMLPLQRAINSSLP